tara:strand:+ start:407 stop:1114 length:708 start_codon:yes stop_codon:yes gene_type:complete
MLPKIATPKYDMIVPSTGESITYRPYVVREEKLLLIAMESQDEKQIEQAVTQIIKSCLDESVDVNSLTGFDIEFVFLTLRASSVGEGIELSITCAADECEEGNTVKVNLDKLEIKNNTFDKKNLQLKLNDNITIELRWPTMGDRGVKGDTGTEILINMVAKSIATIYHGEDIHPTSDVPFEEVVDFVESLSSEQFTKIMEVMGETPYVGYDIEFTCTKCGHENSRELKGLADFFT